MKIFLAGYSIVQGIIGFIFVLWLGIEVGIEFLVLTVSLIFPTLSIILGLFFFYSFRLGIVLNVILSGVQILHYSGQNFEYSLTIGMSGLVWYKIGDSMVGFNYVSAIALVVIIFCALIKEQPKGIYF